MKWLDAKQEDKKIFKKPKRDEAYNSKTKVMNEVKKMQRGRHLQQRQKVESSNVQVYQQIRVRNKNPVRNKIMQLIPI